MWSAKQIWSVQVLFAGVQVWCAGGQVFHSLPWKNMHVKSPSSSPCPCPFSASLLMTWPGQHQGHSHLVSGGEGGSAHYWESQSQCIHLLVDPPGIDHISANSVSTCCMYEASTPLPHLSPSCSMRSEIKGKIKCLQDRPRPQVSQSSSPASLHNTSSWPSDLTLQAPAKFHRQSFTHRFCGLFSLSLSIKAIFSTIFSLKPRDFRQL